ncbi:MAG TPA: PUR family DNA/RNA-binding protein [Verrucomicrobiae bacterium]|nr:PUR family DNA/RNA-binding protein [Verrucomicrobiae bacterium]
MKQNPDLGRPVCPSVPWQWSGVPAGVDAQLQKRSMVVERKHVTFDLRENSRGRFLRIVEEVGGRRNAIIIPMTGIEGFRDALCEVIEFSKTLSPRA